ncbi:MAG TPA: HemK2/MTQ2 family protein methyltransferase [Candidatus Thermoplasmatota archaeon]|nr:HemK2/MTQ2 family protein methyltransferase [Candidatus Thermoplasmatota archaeon]
MPWRRCATAELRSPQGLRYHVHSDVYDPHDDTWLLVDAIRVTRGERFLEVGCGAGLASIHAARDGASVVATDTNPHAVRLARSNARLNDVRIEIARADLLRPIRPGAFDSVAFNPPYLPTGQDDHVARPLDDALAAGPTGRTTLEGFLDALAVSKIPRAWIVASSLQEPPTFAELARARGFRARHLATKRLSFERLTVYDLSVE